MSSLSRKRNRSDRMKCRRRSTPALWPSSAWCRSVDGQQLSSSSLCHFGNLLHAAPLIRYHEERSSAWASEHAGKAAAIQVDGLKHFAPFADAHATLVGNVCIPHGVVHVYADSIWYAVTQVGPYPPVLQASVCGNVESRKAFAMGFGNDQRRIVRSNGYPIWEREAIGDLTD